MNPLRKRIVFWAISFLMLAALQIVFGNFPTSFFKFPLNVVLALLWIYVIFILYRDYRKKTFYGLLASHLATKVTITSLLFGALVIGLFPQLSPTEALVKQGWLSSLGVYNFMSSWIFVGILFFLLTHLGLVTVKALYNRKYNKKRFLLNHFGIWLAIGGGFVGSSDLQTLRIPVFKSEPNNVSYSMDGEKIYLGFEMKLKDFEAEYYDNGMPKSYKAVISMIDEDRVEDITLRVNHPYQKTLGEDIYLTSYDTANEMPEYCIVQVVRQPWKYVQLAGIVMAIAGAIGMFVGGPLKRKDYDDKLG